MSIAIALLVGAVTLSIVDAIERNIAQAKRARQADASRQAQEPSWWRYARARLERNRPRS
jgi:hypothetical protein